MVADTMTTGLLDRVTMNPPASSTVAGNLATMWRRIAAVTIETIDQPVEAATHLRELTDPRLLPIRRRLFRRSRVLVARVPVVRVPVACNHGECSPINLECLSWKRLNRLNHL